MVCVDESSSFLPLKNRKLNFFCDYDDAGFNYRNEVTKRLQELGCSVHLVDVEQLNLPEGGDFIDWKEAKGHITKEDILQLPLIDAPNLEVVAVPFCAFDVRNDGVFYCKKGQLPVWLCAKLQITALTRDPNNENWGRVLEFSDADGHLHRWIMPGVFLKGNGEQAIGELLRLGLTIHPGLKQRKYLLEYIGTTLVETKVRCVPHTGWYEQSFVLPAKVYSPAENKTKETLLYQSDYTLHRYGQLGTLDEWTYNISSYCANNSRLMFSVSLAFAGPLVGLLGLESGGFHLLGMAIALKFWLASVAYFLLKNKLIFY
jgi:putative DNA primase/helicase